MIPSHLITEVFNGIFMWRISGDSKASNIPRIPESDIFSSVGPFGERRRCFLGVGAKGIFRLLFSFMTKSLGHIRYQRPAHTVARTRDEPSTLIHTDARPLIVSTHGPEVASRALSIVCDFPRINETRVGLKKRVSATNFV